MRINLIHECRNTVTNIFTHPDIIAISFLGSNLGGEFIYKTGCANGKRVQSNTVAKNHSIIMHDTDKNDSINALIGACFGSSRQRCMAISSVLFVGEIIWTIFNKLKIK